MDIRFNCHDNLILNNTIDNNVVAGITFMEKSGSNTIIGNKISGNERYGIQIQSDSNGNTINNNTISQSQTGIFLDSDGNRIYSNDIMENVVQAEDREQIHGMRHTPWAATSGATTFARIKRVVQARTSPEATTSGIRPTRSMKRLRINIL